MPPRLGCALGAAEVQSSRNLDLVYTRINERDFLFARYARSAGETREPHLSPLPADPPAPQPAPAGSHS